MGEREAFGPNLRRIRVQRNISLDDIAKATKVNVDLWSALERNDFSRWPTGIYARSYIRSYAEQIGVDADAIVDDFCRWFPQGDRRVGRIVREHAEIVGHNPQWKDDLTGSVTRDRRAQRTWTEEDLPKLAFTRTGRIVAAAFDLGAVVLMAWAAVDLTTVRWATALAAVGLAYHLVALVVLGSSPAVWAIDTYLNHRHPAAQRARPQRFLRLLRGSARAKA
jgi:transcriptional regulator with XRE-family HTH domain